MKTQLVLVSMLLATPALADSHSEKKDAMKKAPPAADKATPPAPAMQAPKPAPEIAAMHKAMTGNWKCTGKGAMDPAKPSEMTEFKGTFKATLDPALDKFWIKGDWAGAAGKLKMKGVMYTTYDPASKKWHRLMVDNWGMSGTDSTSGLPAGTTEGKMVWEGDSRMGPMMMKTHTTEEVAAKSMKMTAEMSSDGGKKWVTGMEMTCTK